MGRRYLTDAALGYGDVSSVYTAVDQLSGQRVAVKILHGQLVERRSLRRRFQAEVHAARSVCHPNVAAALNHGEHARRPFLVTEWLDGVTLAAHLDRCGPLSPRQALTWAAAAARGLCALHRVGIIHRHVNLQNLLMIADGDARRLLKVADFGAVPLTRRFAAAPPSAAVASFLAPEQLAGGAIDAGVDIYALGQVLAVALSGALDPAGLDIVSRALRPTPQQRYPSMRAMLDDIEVALNTAEPPES